MIEDWRAERKLSNGRVRVRHIPTQAVFDVWVHAGEVRVVLRQGAAGNELFDQVKDWYRTIGKDQPDLLQT